MALFGLVISSLYVHCLKAAAVLSQWSCRISFSAENVFFALSLSLLHSGTECLHTIRNMQSYFFQLSQTSFCFQTHFILRTAEQRADGESFPLQLLSHK